MDSIKQLRFAATPLLNRAFALLLLLSWMSPLPAQGFSNAATFNVGAARVVVEDVALCTKYKYPFSIDSNVGSTWPQTGYETCTSESLTTDSLPATLHMKFRVQTNNPDEFLASIADAFIVDAKGVKVSTPRWAPTILVNLDGPVNQKDAIFYGAFLVAGSNAFPVGSYTVTLQLWNSQWTKLKGPVEEVPSSLNIFAFNIYSGKVTASTTSTTTSSSTSTPCKWDSGISASLTKTRSMLAVYTQKVNALTDFSAPGLMELLDSYLADIKKDSLNVVGLNEFADYHYGSHKNCDEYLSYLAESASYSAELSKTQALIMGYYAKAKALAGSSTPKVESTWCETQGNSAMTSIKNSINVFGQYSIKAESRMDPSDKSTIEMLRGWLNTMELEYKNLVTWQEKLAEYSKKEPTCPNFIASSARIPEGIIAYKEVVAKVNAILNKSPVKTENSTTNVDDSLADEDGVEEEPEAKLSVSYSNSLGRFIIKVESNLSEDTLSIRATKKGAKSLRFSVNTNEEGDGGFRTKTKLNGYTLVLYYGTTKLDTARVK